MAKGEVNAQFEAVLSGLASALLYAATILPSRASGKCGGELHRGHNQM